MNIIMNTQLDYKSVIELEKLRFYIPRYQRGYRWDFANVKQFLEDIYENKLELIEELSDENFKTRKELDEYFRNKDIIKRYKYCIQPLVIKKNGDQFNVIDGQQRLTTIFIMIAALKNFTSDILQEYEFFIEYESRDRSKEFLDFLLKCKREVNIFEAFQKEHESSERNIDFDYMEAAFQCSIDWFDKFLSELAKENDAEKTKKYANSLLIILLYCCQFIWYPKIGENEKQENQKKEENEEILWFSKINMGKVELTDVELIKAEFLNPAQDKTDYNYIKNIQISISEKWYEIEAELHKPDFWAFVPHLNQYETISEYTKNKIDDSKKREYKYKTRIDIVFQFLLLENYFENNNDSSIEEYITNFKKEIKQEHFLYNKIKEMLVNKRLYQDEKNGKYVIEECWEKVKDIFENLKELYEDDGRVLMNKNSKVEGNQGLYNLISFLTYITFEENQEYGYIRNYYNFYKILKVDRKDRLNYVKEKIFDELKKMLKINSKENLKSAIQDLKYQESDNEGKYIISNILLLYNVILLNNSPGIGNRYNFLRHKNETWNIEHIFAQNQEVISMDYKLIEKIEKESEKNSKQIENNKSEIKYYKEQLKLTKARNSIEKIIYSKEKELKQLQDNKENISKRLSNVKSNEEKRVEKERNEILNALLKSDGRILNRAEEISKLYSIYDEINKVISENDECYDENDKISMYFIKNKKRIKINLSLDDQNIGKQENEKEYISNREYEYILFLNLLKENEGKNYSHYIELLKSDHRLKYIIEKAWENSKKEEVIFKDILFENVKKELKLENIERDEVLDVFDYDKERIYNKIEQNVKRVIDEKIKDIIISISNKDEFFGELNKIIKIKIENDEELLSKFPERDSSIDGLEDYREKLDWFINVVKKKIIKKLNALLTDEDALCQNQKETMLKIEKELIEKKIYDFFEKEYNDLLKEDSIKNLTLLSPKINRSIGNKSYLEKKNMVYEYMKKGNFIPLTTVFVFADLYTRNTGVKLHWLLESRTQYEKDVLDTVCNFFGKGE